MGRGGFRSDFWESCGVVLSGLVRPALLRVSLVRMRQHLPSLPCPQQGTITGKYYIIST